VKSYGVLSTGEIARGGEGELGTVELWNASAPMRSRFRRNRAPTVKRARVSVVLY